MCDKKILSVTLNAALSVAMKEKIAARNAAKKTIYARYEKYTMLYHRTP